MTQASGLGKWPQRLFYTLGVLCSGPVLFWLTLEGCYEAWIKHWGE